MNNAGTKFDTIQYLVAMLKKYGINNIIASPGRQNANFNYIVQEDPYFNCYSVIDERSAAYVATGIAYETGEPVVITCTGATASRNYLSAMTECYYRKIPVIAITFFNYNSNKFNLAPQFIDRTTAQNDIKYLSVELPRIQDYIDKKRCLTYINSALHLGCYNKLPVHINCPATLSFDTDLMRTLPNDIWKPEICHKLIEKDTNSIKSSKTIIFIGSHNRFSENEEKAISNFAVSYDIPVVCDHTSNYQGKNKILVSKLAEILKIKPELIIDIGDICGEYCSSSIFKNAKIWRVQKDDIPKFRSDLPVEKLFIMHEADFFSQVKGGEYITNGYYTCIKEQISKIQIPDLPLSNALICHKLSKLLPKNCSVHLSILNSLRCMNFFDLDNTINVNCNVGGFGIDGAVSTLVGQSLVNPDKKCFGLIGDLAFFYDMNAIGNRHIKNNLRIIVINNNKGEEFKLIKQIEDKIGAKNDVLIAAGGHNKGGAEGWAKSCGFIYLSAKNKEEFLDKIKDFCTKEYAQPLLFEVFTTDEDEKAGLNLIKNSGNKAVNNISKESDKNNLFTKITNIFSKESK